MSVALDTLVADESLALRRDAAGLRQALRARESEAEAMRRRIERLEKVLRAIAAAGVAHRLNVEKLIAEVL